MIVTKSGNIWDTTIMLIILNSNKNDFVDFVDDVDNMERRDLRPPEQTFLGFNFFISILT